MSLPRIIVERSRQGFLKVNPGNVRIFLDRRVQGRLRVKPSARKPLVQPPQNITVNLVRGPGRVFVDGTRPGRITPIVVGGGSRQTEPTVPPLEIFKHVQTIASDRWVVVHNLGRFPATCEVFVGGCKVEASVIAVDDNVVNIFFASPYSGRAFLI